MTKTKTTHSKIISEKTFAGLADKRSRKLLGTANYLVTRRADNEILMRPLLGELFGQATQVEEFLDSYQAQNNATWRRFRGLTAALKLFSDVCYELLHIRHRLADYHLLPIEHNFTEATGRALSSICSILRRASKELVVEAERLGLSIPPARTQQDYEEELPAGILPQDYESRKTGQTSQTVTMLATSFLNLAAECEELSSKSSAWKEHAGTKPTGRVTEENLRNLEFRFHNLQSLYDTYVSTSEVELLDPELPTLRGHITVVFHLLKTGTSLAHYYERHVSTEPSPEQTAPAPLVDAAELLRILMEYSVFFAVQYIQSAKHLCHQMLKRYAEVGRIELPVPRYRGFHVRPSTLISKIVHHYGSDVWMELDDERYDAGSPMELFRANEKINARKRRWIAEEISRQNLVAEYAGGDVSEAIRRVVMELVKQGKVIQYEQPLNLNERMVGERGTLLETVIAAISELLARGKVDIISDMKAVFVGDKRVLADIKLLADSGYGEDHFGNNIPLPKELGYLRR